MHRRAVATGTQQHLLPRVVELLLDTFADEPFWACIFPTLDSASRRRSLEFFYRMRVQLMMPHSWLIMRRGAAPNGPGGGYSAADVVGERKQALPFFQRG